MIISNQVSQVLHGVDGEIQQLDQARGMNKALNKHVILLSASTTTGKTIHRSLEGIRYYGGVIEAVASVFSTVSEMDGFAVHSVFHAEDLPGYAAYSADDCPFCKKGIKLDAVVNGFGYSKL